MSLSTPEAPADCLTSEAMRAAPARSPRRRLLIVVALVVLIAGTAGILIFRRSHVSPMDALAEISKGAASRHYEGRISARFPYKPWVPAVRSADPVPPAEFMQIRSVQAGAGDAKIHAVADLLLDRADSAIETLEDALRAATGYDNVLEALHHTSDVELLNELAVAYLARGDEDPRNLLKALELSERARQIDGDRIETVWNRALALQRAGFRDEARAAWAHYVDVDPDSRWSTEAQSRLRALADSTRKRLSEELLTALKRAVAARDGATIARLASEDQEQFRLVNEEDVLPDAAAQLPLQGEAWNVAAASASELAARGDPLLADTLSALQRVDSSELSVSVRALNDYRRGRDLMKAGKHADAFAALSAATEGLGRAHNPFAARAAMYRSTVRIYDGNAAEAVLLLDATLQSTPQLDRWPLLGAQLHWVRGLGLSHLGNPGAALRAYDEASRYAVRTREDATRAGLEQVVADALRDVGEFREAWRHHLAAVASLSAAVRYERKLNVLNGVVRAASLEHYRLVPALVHQRVLVLARQANDPLFLCSSLLVGAQTSIDNGDPASANRLLAEAEQAWTRIAGSGMRTRVRADLDTTRFRAMEASGHEADVGMITRSLESMAGIEIRTRLAELHRLRARAYLRREDRDAARSDLRDGVEELNRQRVELNDDEKRTQATVTKGLMEEWLLLELDAGDDEAAFDVAESARARVLLERATGKTAAPRSLRWREIRSRLPDDVALIAFSLVRDRLVVWRGTKSGLSTVQKRVHPVEVRAAVERLRRALVKDSPSDQSVALYELFFGQSVAGLEARKLVLIPDSALFDVPFAALRDSRTHSYLIERFALRLAPSASLAVLQRYSRNDDRRPPLVITVSRRNDEAALPGARAEGNAIAARRKGAIVIVDAAATLAAFEANVSRSGSIHFAGHGVADPAQPERSALLLGGDERLTAARVSAMNLDGVNLVVLSACRTADGTSEADAPLTMATAFLAAGVPTVVATTMDIDDAATAQLFDAFYAEYESGRPADESLRDAQLRLLRNPRYATPHDWAPFVAIGNSLATRAK